MAYGVVKSISLRYFVEGSLSLELPHIYMLFFPNPLSLIFPIPFIIFSSPLYKVSSFNIVMWDQVGTERVELMLWIGFY
jgi:hypothetical protein